MCEFKLSLPAQSLYGNGEGKEQEGRGRTEKKVLGGSNQGRPTHRPALGGQENLGEGFRLCPPFQRKDFLGKQYAQRACIVSTG